MNIAALVVVKEDVNASDYCTLYKHHDGHPGGLGFDILEYIKDKPVVYGLSTHYNFHEAFNGIGDFCASFISYFKKCVGDLYVEEACIRNVGEKYIYTITVKPDKPIELECFDVYKNEIVDLMCNI